jgi:hypothetical protein
VFRALTRVLAHLKVFLLGITGRPAHPFAQRLTGVPLTEADMPDARLLLVDGYALLVTVRRCDGSRAEVSAVWPCR